MTDPKDKDLENLSSKIEKIETVMDKNCEKLQELETKTTACRLGCELPAYKIEMRERCEKLNNGIKTNNEICKTEKQNILDKIRDLSDEFEYKFKQSKTLIGRVISTCVIFGVALIGVFGSIQINKVSRQEYNNHLEAYRVDRQEQADRFEKFLSTYSFDRNKRDEKIDKMFQKQIDFNQEIVKSNAILQQQLEVLKTQINIKKLNE